MLVLAFETDFAIDVIQHLVSEAAKDTFFIFMD